mgnify:CR=1 FL=1
MCGFIPIVYSNVSHDGEFVKENLLRFTVASLFCLGLHETSFVNEKILILDGPLDELRNLGEDFLHPGCVVDGVGTILMSHTLNIRPDRTEVLVGSSVRKQDAQREPNRWIRWQWCASRVDENFVDVGNLRMNIHKCFERNRRKFPDSGNDGVIQTHVHTVIQSVTPMYGVWGTTCQLIWDQTRTVHLC